MKKILGLSFMLFLCISLDAMQSVTVPQCPQLPKRKTQAQLRAENFELLKAQYKQDGYDPLEDGILDFDPATADLFEFVGAGDVERLAQALQAGASRYGFKQRGYTLRQFAQQMNNGTLAVLDQYQPQRYANLFGASDE